jgi:hypothetical protein
MSDGSGLPVVRYTPFSSTRSHAMWHDYSSSSSTKMCYQHSCHTQPVSTGAYAVHAGQQMPRVQIVEKGAYSVAQYWCSVNMQAVKLQVYCCQATSHVRVMLLLCTAAGPTCRMLSVRRMSPPPSVTRASMPPGPSFTLQQQQRCMLLHTANTCKAAEHTI